MMVSPSTACAATLDVKNMCVIAFLVESINCGGCDKPPVLRQVMYTADPHDNRLHLHSCYGAHTVPPGDDLLLKTGVLNAPISKSSLHAPSERSVTG